MARTSPNPLASTPHWWISSTKWSGKRSGERDRDARPAQGLQGKRKEQAGRVFVQRALGPAGDDSSVVKRCNRARVARSRHRGGRILWAARSERRGKDDRERNSHDASSPDLGESDRR